MKKNVGEEIAAQIFCDDHEDYKIIEAGEFIDEGKYGHCTRIVEDIDGDHWEVCAGRSGSYFTDYEYTYEPELIEVEQQKVTVTKWVAVKE